MGKNINKSSPRNIVGSSSVKWELKAGSAEHFLQELGIEPSHDPTVFFLDAIMVILNWTLDRMCNRQVDTLEGESVRVFPERMSWPVL